MKVFDTPLPGVKLIEPAVYGDARGFFYESYNERAFAQQVADVRFVQDMIVHHRQAVDMSLLAPSRTGSDAIRRLAARINDTQELEIGMMTRWLREQGQRVPGHHGGGRDHSGMPGMATPEQLDRLRAASGTEFDRLFVELMIAHHQGAITMATRVLSAGSHTTIQQLATDISVEQAAEIRRMQRLL